MKKGRNLVVSTLLYLAVEDNVLSTSVVTYRFGFVDRGLVIPAVVRGRLIEPRGGGKAGSEAGLGIAIAASAEGSPAADGELVDLRRSLT
jgi:hypothetical protein